MKIKNIARKVKILILITAVAIAASALTACKPGTRLAQIITGADVPSVEFVTPRYYEYRGLSATGEYLIPVMVEVSEFELVDRLGQENVAGEGHIHFFLDITPPSLLGKDLVPAEGLYGDTRETAYYWENIGLGEHTGLG